MAEFNREVTRQELLGLTNQFPIEEEVLGLMQSAQNEADRLNHNFIGTEHLLLGYTNVGNPKVVDEFGFGPSEVRRVVQFVVIGMGDRRPEAIGLTPRAKKVFPLAADEARVMGDESVSNDHVLLGLIKEGEGIAVGVLESVGVNLHKLREAIKRVRAEAEVAGQPARQPDSIDRLRAYIDASKNPEDKEAILGIIENLLGVLPPLKID